MDSLLQWLIYGGLFFFMMRSGCGAHMFRRNADADKKVHSSGHGGSCCHDEDNSVAAPAIGIQGPPPKSDADPVCGKIVSTEGAKASLHDGLVYFFCSAECRETFEGSPEKYTETKHEVTPLRIEQNGATDGRHV